MHGLRRADIAQLVVQLIRNQQVASSSLAISTNKKLVFRQEGFLFFMLKAIQNITKYDILNHEVELC